MKSLWKRISVLIITMALITGFMPVAGGIAYAADDEDEILYVIKVTTDDNGTASATPTEQVSGKNVYLYADADDGYVFDSWEVVSGGVTVRPSTFAAALFKVENDNVTIKANFRERDPDHVLEAPANPRWDGDIIRWDPVTDPDDSGEIVYNVRLYNGDDFDSKERLDTIVDISDNYVDLSTDEHTAAEKYRTGCGNFWFSVQAVQASTVSYSSYAFSDAKFVDHEIVYKQATLPTCTEDGYESHWECARCGKVFTDKSGTTELDRSVITWAATGHDWDNGIVTVEPGCETKGEKVYTCKTCGETKTVKIKELGHSYGPWVTTREAACDREGEQTRTCANCGATLTREIKKVDHTWGEWKNTKAATCDEDGENARICQKCGQTQVETIKATGHNWDSGKVTTQPTCEEEGVRTYTCSKCGGTKTEAISALGHKWDSGDVITEATCEEDGSMLYTCTVCGTSKITVIEAPGHTWEDVEILKEATCTEVGSKNVKCSVCDTEGTLEIPMLDHNWADVRVIKEPTCATVGYKLCKCTMCGEEKTVELEMTDHVWGKEQIVVEPTCTVSGTKAYTCVNCGKKSEHTLPPTGHKWGAWELITPPTATNTGIERRVCTNDRTHKQSRELPVLAGDCSAGALVYDAQLSIFSQSTDRDPSGSTFSPLCARSVKYKKNAITVKWNKVSGADGYIVYGNRCGGKHGFRKLAEVSAGTTKFTNKKLRTGTYYKYVVVAYKNVGKYRIVVSTSKTIHAATKGGKAGNTKAVKITNLKKKAKTLSKGKTFKLKVKTTVTGGTVRKHRKLCYGSTNAKVAKVSSSGKITAVGKGTCYIYVYAQNGKYTKVKITVK